MRRVDIQENLKVLIIDDNYDHAAGLRDLLSIESDYQIVGTITSVSIAASMIKKHNPDVVLMDINMPDIDGITAINEIKKQDNKIKVIAVTGYDDSDLIFRAMKVGARGYILKTMAASQLVNAINEVASGKIYLPPILAAKFFDHFHAAFQEEIKNKPEETENLLCYLTQREEEVLHLLTEGITYKGVASRLFISETTVKTHVNNIFQKLQVNDRTQAVLYAINHGLEGKRRLKMKTAV